MKTLSVMGAWMVVAVMLSGCSAEVDESPAPDEDVTASHEELKNWGGSTPGSCLDRCLTLCPKDGQGGIDVGCALTCLGACSSTKVSISTVGAVAVKK